MSEAFNEAVMPTDYISPTHQMSPERSAEMVAMAAAVEAFASRPANLRDPESKKVLCHQCRTRMTLAAFRQHTHTIRFENLNLPHVRQRKNPHFSKRRLQLVERTRSLLPPFGEDFNEDDIMYVVKETRVKAAREIRKETDEAAKKKRMQQKASRKANQRRA